MEKQPFSGILSPCQEKEATRKYGFTLVELIVVITILAILGTIAFISLQGYSISARDSTRISDLSSMKTSLELFQLDAGKYPETTSGFTVTYSGAEVWTQGTFGGNTKINVEKLDKIPKDPLTDKEYTYSITKTKQEYQLAGLIEGDLAYSPHPNPLPRGEGIATLLNQTNATEIIATAIVTGNYNGQTLKSETGVICEVLSIPSIISSEISTTDLKTILDNKSLVYNGFNNLPSNYKGSKYKTSEGFEFISEKLVVYSDNQECKPLYDTENATARINLVKNLQTAYSGTIIENSENISGLVNLDVSNSQAINLFSATLVNNNLGGSVIINGANNTLVNACSTQPEYTGATYEIGIATEPDQAWQSSNVNAPCYWTCGTGKVLDENTCVSETCAGTTPDGTAKVSNATSFAGGTWGYNITPGKCTYTCGIGYHSEDNNNCILNTYTVSGSFGANANGAIINVCGTNVTGDSSGNFTSIRNYGAVCNPITATKIGYSCNTTTNGPASLTSNTTNIAGSCTIINTIANCQFAGQMGTSTTTYTGCNKEDIIVCSGNGVGYIISSCNVGTNTAGTGTSSFGESFQWGNNAGIRTAGTSTTQISISSINSIYSSNIFIYDQGYWNLATNGNIWGDTTNTNLARKGPCITGYHVPTKDEWIGINAAGGWLYNGTNIYTGQNMLTDLKLPKAGFRYGIDATMRNIDNGGYYWSSSFWGSGGYSIRLFATNDVSYFESASNGLSVRCFKN